MSGNAAQARYWNEAPGQKWVTFQAELDALHASVTEVLLAAAGSVEGLAVLDIGTGAGATALAFARAVGPEGRVTGADISAPLLARAAERAEGVANLDFRLGDVAEMDLGGPFDLVISRFGTMFFADPVAAMAHVRAAVRHGGRGLFACWTAAAENPWFAVPNAIAAERLGPTPPAPPGAPNPTAWGDIGRVTDLLGRAGWSDPQGAAMTVTLMFPGTPQDVAQMALRVGGVTRAMTALNGTAEDAAAIAAKVAAWAEAFAGPDGVAVPARINLFTARA